jgi:IMP dehydrogenase/GMP reductase
MEEEFYASIKLMSGEEIVAKVSYDNDEDVLIIENPRVVNVIEMKKGRSSMKGFTFETWMTATYDEMFIIKKDHILTITELDTKIQKFYQRFLQKENGEIEETTKVDIKHQRGYMSSVKEARKSLEDLYKRS